MLQEYNGGTVHLSESQQINLIKTDLKTKTKTGRDEEGGEDKMKVDKEKTRKRVRISYEENKTHFKLPSSVTNFCLTNLIPTIADG